MARGIQLHCNRHVAIDVPVCVDWFLTFQRDKMSFLERSQWLGAFQNCYRVRCEASTREIPSAKKEKDGAALTARESACEERNRLKVSLLTRVLFSSVYYLSRVCVTRRFLRTYDRSRRNRSDETMRLSTLVTKSKIVLGWNLRGRIRTGSSILGYAWR